MRFDAVMHAELKWQKILKKRIKIRHSGCRFESASLWLLAAQCANNTGSQSDNQLTPRYARCSTPPALKTSFTTGGVLYRLRGGGATLD
ncbi:hypothetical protein RCN42_10470 [Escherichia marmotae]|uniref:hypothetical protein n=1 Tax=Escherichia marmotae TaxID=1499973 RepID=UPI002816766C|nr:hypothetical protein [Escherichia marmotae]MED9659483.1 hypothetical protein [Escherichia marmotae]